MQKILVCKCVWETSEETKRRGQVKARSVAQSQPWHILESGHSHRGSYSRVHKGNCKEVNGRTEVGTIAKNQCLACQGQGGHERGYPNNVEVFVQRTKRKRLLKV